MAGIDFIHQNGVDYEIVPEIAPLFKTTVAYHTGDHVIYEAGWYTFKADKPAGAWDATKVNGPFKVSEQLTNLKEDLSTLNTEGTVPTSEQMLSDNYTEDSVPYHFRKTASDNADREELEIVGGSVAWNQLERFNRNSETINNISYTNNGDGSFTVTGQASANTPVLPSTTNTSTPYIEGHVYYGFSNIAAASDSTVSIGIYINAVARALPGTACVLFKNVTEHFTGNIQIGYRVISGYNSNGMTIKGGLIDLTQMFGSTIADYIYSLEQATAGAGVALFRSLFPRDYYAYDAGSMQSVSGLSEHKTVGFNIIDESKIVAGNLNTGTGNAQSSTSRCITDFTEIASNREYYCRATQSAGVYAFFYDANKTYIGYHAYPLNGTTFIPANLANAKSGATGNIGDTAVYMRLRYDIGAVYNNTLCVNVSDTSLNGQYIPYSGKHTYALDDSLTLRGIPTLIDGKIKWDGDVYSADGTVTRRYGIVDLGTLAWSTGDGFFYSSYGYKKEGNTNIICAKYPTSYSESAGGMADKTIKGQTGTKNIYLKDSSYTDVTTLKTSLSGVYLVYELATPTTEQADPYISPQICHYDGTEEFVSTGIVPVGHVTKYPDNMRKKLDNLPWNFASLIAPTESGFKATQNYTTGQLLIVNNVLYKATANIANGATITPNTNVTATTLAEVIAALS